MIARETTPLTFVPVQEEHLPDIMAISADAYPDSWTEGMFRDEFGNHLSHFYVAFDGATLVGYAGFWLVADEVHITTIAVRLDRRGRGYGRQLMDHLLESAGALGATLAALEVRATNAPAINLYTALGFRIAGRRKGYYSKTNEDAIVMMKDLS
ncbi:MAG: ribosomal protein S18-alanine N-acetyltransferase [Candidatus Hydrogenedentes bacterium]|nr:ribosomal protein S18-alanine N-acetyltransferase [Candidatus Hydrogenedentota bacterium]